MDNVEFSKGGRVMYTVDRKNNLVTARFTCKEEEPQCMFDSQLRKLSNAFDGSCVAVESDYACPAYYINRVYIGKAKCHPNDKFDPEFGKRLALLRAKEKHLRAVEKKLSLISRWVEDLNNRTKKMYLSQYRQLIDTCGELYSVEKETGLYDSDGDE